MLVLVYDLTQYPKKYQSYIVKQIWKIITMELLGTKIICLLLTKIWTSRGINSHKIPSNLKAVLHSNKKMHAIFFVWYSFTHQYGEICHSFTESNRVLQDWSIISWNLGHWIYLIRVVLYWEISEIHITFK